MEIMFHWCFLTDVWCGMIEDMWIVLVILDYRMTGSSYLGFLQNGFSEQLQGVPLATRSAVYFQHYRVPIHCTHPVLQHLRGIFLNRWISCGSILTVHHYLPTNPHYAFVYGVG
jgi:hypothetical protein